MSRLVQAAFVLVLGPFAWVPAVSRWARRLVPLENGRSPFPYLVARLLPTLLGALAVGLLGVGAVLAGIVVVALVRGRMPLGGALLQMVIGAALLLINLQAIASVGRLDRWLAVKLLDPDPRAALERRITELTASRAAVVTAVDAERRRIERDLHDGLQQRLVALGMLLGRARRSADPAKARELLDQAHADAQRAVDDLREVAWRVYPSALDHSTLDEVLTMVARRSPVPVRIRYEVTARPPAGIDTVLYFVACEAITNTAKHAAATVIDIVIEDAAGGVVMTVRDDGRGGADPQGSGLSGLARRVTALDGSFAVSGPPGEGTAIRVELPCG